MLSNNLTDYIFKAFGLINLTEDHATTYLKLLNEGLCTTTTLSKYSDIPRTTFYDLLEDLIDWNLAKKVKTGNKTLFECTDPYRLLDAVTGHKNECNDIEYYLKRNIHSLVALYEKTLEEIQIETTDLDKLETGVLIALLSESKTIRIVVNSTDQRNLSLLTELKESFDDTFTVRELIYNASESYLKSYEETRFNKLIIKSSTSTKRTVNFIKIVGESSIIRINESFFSIERDQDSIETESVQFDQVFN